MRITRWLLTILFVFLVSPAWAAPQKVTVAKHGPGQWELLVNNQPFFIKGVVYNFTVVGDDPGQATMRDWHLLDLDSNGKNDLAYDAWVDQNLNNVQDPDEPGVGDWQLLKDLGANTIRVYQMPSDDKRISAHYQTPGLKLTFNHPPNKQIFRELYERYGVMTAVGHFFGEWSIGAGVPNGEPTDYTNPQQRKNLLDNIRVMVEEHKDEPYTLLWILGNENFNPGDMDNAETQVEAFLTLVNEAAKLIHELDPNHPVAVCNWHTDHLADFARWAPDVDIFGMNAYSQWFAFDKIRDTFDRPVLLTEFGTPAFKDDDFYFNIQKSYHKSAWGNIVDNRYGGKGVGNSIGGMLFQWADMWYFAGAPAKQNAADPGMWQKYIEWHGIAGQGDGKHSPFIRQLKKAYFLYQDFWKNPQ